VFVCGLLISGCGAATDDSKAPPRTQDRAATTDPETPERSSRSWASATVRELTRRARIARLDIENLSCEELACSFRWTSKRPDDDLPKAVSDWLTANWTFRHRIDEQPNYAAGVRWFHVTLYRHPADRSEGSPGYSSLRSDAAVPACNKAADCSHPNWSARPLCDSDCPEVTLDSRTVCFASLQDACKCLASRGESSAPPCGRGVEEGYEY
jgi:hypothetical protein